MHGVVDNCWWLFKWALAVCLVAGGAAALQRVMHVDDEIRARVEARLASGYPNLQVTVRSARRIEGEGIEVRGVSIRDPKIEGPLAELAYFDELLLACPTELAQLARQDPVFSKITLRHVIIRPTRQANGTWTTAQLLPIPQFGPTTPPIVLENTGFEIRDPTHARDCQFNLSNLRLSLLPVDLTASPMAHGSAKPPLPSMTGLGTSVKASMTGDFVEQVQITGLYDAKSGRFDLEGSAEGIRIAPELHARLPAELANLFKPMLGLRGLVRVGFAVQHEPKAAQPWRFDARANLTNGRFSDARLPYTVTDLRGQMRVHHAGFVVEELAGQCGPALLRGSAKGNGFKPNSRIEIEVDAQHVRLEKRLASVLPDALRQSWYKFLPEGDIDTQAKFVFDGSRWIPEASVNCREVSFSYFKFPYRLEQGKGTLHLQDKQVSLKMTAAAGSQLMRLRGEFNHPGPAFTGWLEIAGDGVPIDDKLLTALPEKSQWVVRSLQPQGTLNVFGRIWRESQHDKIHRQVLLSFNRCSINYQKFPYPLANIRGIAEWNDDQWSFRDLVGINDTGTITCQGHLIPAEQGSELALRFTGERVPLEEELRLALPSNMQQLWRSLQPAGEVNLTADVKYLSAVGRMSTSLVAEPRGGTSIEPLAFPYRLDKLRGRILYRDGHADFENIKAEHGRTSLATEGHCDFTTDGSWALQLRNFTVDRLRADHDLLTALPPTLKRGISQIKPSGPINLRGSVTFARPGSLNAELQTQWDVVADLMQNHIDCGERFEHLFGSVRLMGSSVGEQFTSRGELALDSLFYRNFQFTEVLGPLYIDNSRIAFGGWAEATRPGYNSRRVTAKLCGGNCSLDAQASFADVPRYAVQAQVADADLRLLLAENLPRSLNASGRLAADVQLEGNSRGLHTLAGRGAVRLYDADIYQLPMMVSMLKLLSIKQPDATAFTKSDIDFRIQGEHLLFDRINFNGDAVSMLGKGQMSFDRALDLTFHAMVGRDDSNFHVPVLRGVLGEASQQIMQIRVEGTCDNPETRREAFPGVNRALQALQAEMNGSNQQPVAREAVLPR